MSTILLLLENGHLNFYAFQQPSVQKLITSVAAETIVQLAEETLFTDAYTLPILGAAKAMAELQSEFPAKLDKGVLDEALKKAPLRVALNREARERTVRNVFFKLSSYHY